MSRMHIKIDRTNACSSFSLDDRLTFLSLHIGFNFASAAAVCAAIARTSVFEPSSPRKAPRYLTDSQIRVPVL